MREMKDSGIEWIGKIPRHWIYPKITYILDTEHEYPIGDGDHGTIKADNYVQEGIPFIRVQNLGFATPLRLDDVVYITKKQNITIKNSTLKPDDILFAKTGATIGKVGIVPKELLISNTTSHVGKITVNKKIIVPRFLFYALSSTVGYKLLWDIAGQKSTRPELSIEEIKRLHIILPDSLQEQQTIVDYLDAKCADIDSLTADIQKQINILKEYKKSVITQAVTKGLDSNVEMKDSGIAWIGKIPRHWALKRIKHTANLNGRIGWQGLTSKEYQYEGAILVTGVNFSLGRINWESCYRVSFERWKQAPEIQLKNGDLLITKDGTVGKVAIVKDLPQKATLNSGVLKITLETRINTKFMYWVLLSEEFWRWFTYKNAGSSTIIHLYQNDFTEFKYAVPPLKEQKVIADFLDSKCADIDAIISGKQKQLDVLKEYKKSLIYEYVTGKKEVPCHE